MTKEINNYALEDYPRTLELENQELKQRNLDMDKAYVFQINAVAKENEALKEYKAHQEQAYRYLQTERDEINLRIETAFHEGFNVGKKFATATDAWLQSEARARGKE